MYIYRYIYIYIYIYGIYISRPGLTRGNPQETDPHRRRPNRGRPTHRGGDPHKGRDPRRRHTDKSDTGQARLFVASDWRRDIYISICVCVNI